MKPIDCMSLWDISSDVDIKEHSSTRLQQSFIASIFVDIKLWRVMKLKASSTILIVTGRALHDEYVEWRKEGGREGVPLRVSLLKVSTQKYLRLSLIAITQESKLDESEAKGEVRSNKAATWSENLNNHKGVHFCHYLDTWTQFQSVKA